MFVFYYHIIGLAITNKKREVESGSLSQGLLRFKELRFEFSYGSDVVSENLSSYRQEKCMAKLTEENARFCSC